MYEVYSSSLYDASLPLGYVTRFTSYRKRLASFAAEIDPQGRGTPP